MALVYHTIILGIHDTCRDANLNSRNDLIVKLTGTSRVPLQVPIANQSQNIAAQHRPDPVKSLSSTPNSMVTI